eukprot:168659-Prorocentrum_minimum.AAC.1
MTGVSFGRQCLMTFGTSRASEEGAHKLYPQRVQRADHRQTDLWGAQQLEGAAAVPVGGGDGLVVQLAHPRQQRQHQVVVAGCGGHRVVVHLHHLEPAAPLQRPHLLAQGPGEVNSGPGEVDSGPGEVNSAPLQRPHLPAQGALRRGSTCVPLGGRSRMFPMRSFRLVAVRGCSQCGRCDWWPFAD